MEGLELRDRTERATSLCLEERRKVDGWGDTWRDVMDVMTFYGLDREGSESGASEECFSLVKVKGRREGETSRKRKSLKVGEY